ncbi:MAG: uracil-DNA glycosylase [Melioribacteraceae bacterium]|nr:uracil-DNA glycosylase [Melioribacteraceae bacterium]
MNEHLKKLLLESLKDQKEIFGDLLFDKLEVETVPVKPQKISLNEKEPAKPKLEIIEQKNDIVIPPEFSSCSTLEELNSKICNCVKCELGKTRNKFVFGAGNPNSEVMLIGEAPGADEDKQGIPFVGKAGQLLTDILKAINFERDDLYIANILKCRPPNNRTPVPAEMDICIPYLWKQIELINPKVILCLGLTAATGLLKLKLSLTKMRGNIYELNGIKTMVTYHPAALLRNPNWKRGCWEDVQQFRKLYDELTEKN